MLTTPASRNRHALLVKTLVTIIVLGAVIYQIDIYRTVVRWQEADWAYVFILGFPVFLLCLFINVLRWYLILGHQGISHPLPKVASMYTKAAFVASFLPGGMTAGDIYRVRLLTANTKDVDASIKSVLLDRGSGLIGLLIVALTAFIYVSWRAGSESPLPLLQPMIVVACLCCAVVIVFLAAHRYRLEGVHHPLLVKLRSYTLMVPAYFSDKRLIVKEVLLSLSLQLVIVGWVYIVAKALQISVSFMALSLATPLVTLCSLLPISLGGVGVREASYVLFLAPFGITAGEATSLSLVSGVVQGGLRFICGLVFVWDRSNTVTDIQDHVPAKSKPADGRGC
jgi:uncharacterized protein (TIRG00374 family)